MQRIVLGLIALAMIATGIWLGQKRIEPFQAGASQIENGFFQQVVHNPQGKEVALSYWKNRPVLVNFWASYCKPCLEEMPLLEDLTKEWQGEVEIIGISLDTVEKMNAHLAQHPVTYPVFSAGTAGLKLAQSLGNSADAIPYTVIFDGKGQLVWTKLGKVEAEVLRSWKTQFVK